jgi:hypothetical protein
MERRSYCRKLELAKSTGRRRERGAIRGQLGHIRGSPKNGEEWKGLGQEGSEKDSGSMQQLQKHLT